jgi:hypothetical protein
MGDWAPESGVDYDIGPWSRPLHKVTLNGFPMMAVPASMMPVEVQIGRAYKFA